MRAWLDNEGLELWENRLYEIYDRDRDLDLEDMHISDLVSCLRRPVLSAEYDADFETRTLWMFTLGRAFERVVFQYILGGCECACHQGQECTLNNDAGSLSELELSSELEVIEGGFQGHIDFGGRGYDIETKCSWKRKPRSDQEVQDLFDKADYWVDQAASYAVMRRRTQARFLILHISSFPFAELGYYGLEWTRDELGDHWRMMNSRRDHVRTRVGEGRLPVKTLQTSLCSGCQVKWACDLEGD